MHFYAHKRRGAPAVIIVALIDVLIVLVIFLLVTTTFKQQAALKVQLPESSQAQKSGANENPPVVVSVDAAGLYYLDKLPVTFDQLQDRLKSEASKNPNVALAVNADEKAPWGKMVKIHDAAIAAKIKSFVAFTKEPTRK